MSDRSSIDYAVKKIRELDGSDQVQFIILYGSVAEGRETCESDIDICVGFDGDRKKASEFRFKILSELFSDKYDIQIFQLLPLYVQKEVLRGEILYCKDRKELYDAAYNHIKEFNDFRHRYYDYIDKEAIT